MKTQFLFPRSFRTIGIFLTTVTVLILLTQVLGVDAHINLLDKVQVPAILDTGSALGSNSSYRFFTMIEDDFGYEVLNVMGILGCLFWGFSREKVEDELIAKLRLESLLWATYVHFFVFLIFILGLYGTGFTYVLYFNMYVVLVLFIIRFRVVLLKAKRKLAE